jgi:chlorobactene glucosyltransferase
MSAYFTHNLIFHLVVFQAILLLILLGNIYSLRHARRHAPPEKFPSVSVLVPARNEERSINRCIQSLLEQDYPSFEVLVLDDGSADGTRAVLDGIARSQPRLIILDGQSPPPGQMGKNWACTQLAEKAGGELLYFTDADTWHRPVALREFVTALLHEQADLLTGFPRQEMHSWGERLLVPFFSWALLNFIPLWLGYRIRLPALASAVGQVMLFRRTAYDEIGGHGSLSMSLVDDLALARKTKSASLRWRVAHASDLVSCRMYHSGREAVEGFTKNLFAAFDNRLLPFLAAFVWLLVMFWEPLVVLLLWVSGMAPQASPLTLAACLLLSLLLWIIHHLELRLPPLPALLYPIIIMANALVALRSLVYSLGGWVTWKGRRVSGVRWKWW